MKRITSLILIVICIALPLKAQNLKKGFWGSFDMSYGLTLSDKGSLYKHKYGGSTHMQAFDLRTEFGYYFTRAFSIGAGIGVATYSEPRINWVPVFVDFRYHPITHINENFYVGFDFGTGLMDNQKKLDPKFFMELYAGYKLFDIGRFTLAPAIGYSFYKYSVKSDGSGFAETMYTYKQKRNTLFLRLSLSY